MEISVNNLKIKGLNNDEVLLAREKYGLNQLIVKKESPILDALKTLIKEPMVIILLVAASIYFVSGKNADGFFLAFSVILVAIISLYQDSKSRSAIKSLETFIKPLCKVIREGKTLEIKTEELVLGDSMIVEEGTSVPADGFILNAHDFSVNEAILTGESFSVFKDQNSKDNLIWSGTHVTSGLAISKVTAIGSKTRLGEIGQSISAIKEEKTLLELQIGSFVKVMVIIGTVVFLIVWILNYIHSLNLFDSLLKALTLAMSILPEEIPVAYTTFMALGAWRLMKIGIVVKKMKTVEALGNATVICTDKTGTITENKMKLAKLYQAENNQIIDLDGCKLTEDDKNLIRWAMWASEPIPFDPMEIEIHKIYGEFAKPDERVEYKMTHEYPLEGKPPMMTHVFMNSKGNRITSAKGAPEAILAVSDLQDDKKNEITMATQKLANQGYRVLGVAMGTLEGIKYPKKQQDIKFEFKGLIAFYDPPKKNIAKVFQGFYDAGIAVKIITGDNAETTTAIAKQTGFKGYDKFITGDDLMKANNIEILNIVSKKNIFTRMFPEAKLKIINGFKANKDVVAMTGDGVNDGQALKAANIGIAMGKKGSEIAKQAASLILVDDDLSKMLDAIAMGRKIYANLKKAIRYIISIHIPIVLIVFLPLVLGWIYPNIFSPVHIIFLELIMGPTCSIIYENEPIERNTMLQKPHLFTTNFFNTKELFTSILQGLIITICTLAIYRYSVYLNYNEAITRTMIFSTLIVANIFLTLENRSFYYSILTTIRYKNNLVLWIIVATITTTGLLIYVKPFAKFFMFQALNFWVLLQCIGAGIISVIWFELVKIRIRQNKKKLKRPRNFFYGLFNIKRY